MELEQYQSAANATKTVFVFVSEGPKGNILKRVQYDSFKLEDYGDVYNLCFGDLSTEAVS